MQKNLKVFFVLLALTLLLVKTALHRIGDYDLRLTIQSSDDGPVAYAYAYKYKEIFDKDIEQRVRYASQSASAQNWIPAVLFKYLDIEPYYVTYASTLLQTILLGFAMFFLVYSLFPESILIAFLAAMASASFPVFEWNMALYGQIMFMPYAAHLAVPFSIFSIAFIFRNQFKWGIALNLLCGMVHPSFGVYTLAFNAVQFLIYSGQYDFKQSLKENFIKNKPLLFKMITYFGFSALFIILPIIMQRTAPQIAANIQFNSWECNGHLFPLNGHYCKGLAELGMRSVPILVLLLFGFLPFMRGSKLSDNKLFRFGLSVIVGVALLILVNVYATYGRVWNLGLLATFRSSQVLSIIFLGLVLVAGSISAKKGVLIFFPFLLLVIAYLARAPNMVYLSNEIIITFSILGVFALFFNKNIFQNKWFVSIFYLIVSGYFIKSIGVDFDRKYIIALQVALGAGLVFIWLPVKFKTSFAHTFLIISVFHYGMDNINIENKSADGDYTRALYDAQMWAYKNSKPEEGFILVGIPTWRNFSRRPVVSFGSGTPYGTPIFAEEYGKKIVKLTTEIREKVKEEPGPVPLERLNTQGLKLFGKEMGAGYIVVPNKNNIVEKMDLQKLFGNSEFTIYSLM